MKNLKLSWVVFLILAAVMFFLRYGTRYFPDCGFNAPDSVRNALITYGPYVFFAIHVALVLLAFQDTVFQGILALLIPFYSFYWLFIVSDAFLLRSIVAALLVGIGIDSIQFYQIMMNDVMRDVHKWIASGG